MSEDAKKPPTPCDRCGGRGGHYDRNTSPSEWVPCPYCMGTGALP